MAARKIHRYLAGADRLSTAGLSDHPFELELDEAEVWSASNVTNMTESKIRPVSNQRQLRKSVRKSGNFDHLPVGPKSLPVNIPDWSKILRDEFRKRGEEFTDDEVEEDDGNERMPPHEYLARTRAAPFSVHEGVGRTLKGRDLSRVRNAIWKQTGFAD